MVKICITATGKLEKSCVKSQEMHPYAKVFKLFLRQAKPVDLAKALLGKKLHMKTIAAGLRDIKEEVYYSIHA